LFHLFIDQHGAAIAGAFKQNLRDFGTTLPVSRILSSGQIFTTDSCAKPRLAARFCRWLSA
jgi:hypothetical protein